MSFPMVFVLGQLGFHGLFGLRSPISSALTFLLLHNHAHFTFSRIYY
jgi:hypothetical protein